MKEDQSRISVQVHHEVKDALLKVAKKKNIFLSDVIRQSLGWEEVDIFPKTLSTKYDMNLISNMAVTELPLNFAIEKIDEMLGKITNPKKVKTLKWIKRRYTWVYENLKNINSEFIEQIDDDGIIVMGEYYNSFLDFINKSNKTKDDYKKFAEGCK